MSERDFIKNNLLSQIEDLQRRVAELERFARVLDNGHVGVVNNLYDATGGAGLFDGEETAVCPGAVVVGPGTQGARTLNVASLYWNITNDTTRSTYLHIQTPWKTGSYRMFHLQARGYSLRAGTGNHGLHLHLVWSGYLYNTGLIETSYWDPTGVLAPTAYIGSDDHLYLRAGPSNWYATTLALDSVYCTGGGVLTRADLAITFSTSATL